MCPIAVLLLAAGALLTAPAAGQDAKPENRNAAIRYGSTFLLASAETVTKITAVDMTKVPFTGDLASAPQDFRDAAELARKDAPNLVEGMIEASRLARCDFELPMEKGVNVLLPHLSKFRDAVRIMRVDARARLLSGDAQGAAERIAAILRIAEHVRRDNIMISSLVAAAIATVGVDEAQGALDAGRLTTEARRTVIEALRSIPSNDPFGVKDALRGERRMAGDWIKATFHGDDAGKQLCESGYFISQSDRAENKAAQTVALMNESQLGASVDLLRPYYDQAIAAWDKPDAVAQLEALRGRLEQGEFGPLGTLLGPAIANARKASLKAEARIDHLRESIGDAR